MSSDLFARIRLFRGGGNDSSRSPPDPDRSRIKRALFGPPDPEANRRFVEEELAKGHREMAARYNFDFLNGQPLEGRWKWEPVTGPSVGKENVASSTATTAPSERDEQVASLVKLFFVVVDEEVKYARVSLSRQPFFGLV